MPTTTLLEQLEIASERGPVSLYGFEDEVFGDIKELLKALEREDPEIDPTDRDELTSKLIRSGPCPNSSRIYYWLTEDPSFESSEDSVEELLGREFDPPKSRRKAGMAFEDWVDDANLALNDWLDTRDEEVFVEADLPPDLQAFYLARTEWIEELANGIVEELPSLRMEVNEPFKIPFFTTARPDGAWLMENEGGVPGGVFESKMSKLPTPVDKHTLTGYALYLENANDVPIDIAVYLHLDEDDEEIEVYGFQVTDGLREEIRLNLERFAVLVEESITKGRWEQGGPLTDRLIEPEEPEIVSHCKECPFSEPCHGE